jgi:hypothetical protein
VNVGDISLLTFEGDQFVRKYEKRENIQELMLFLDGQTPQSRTREFTPHHDRECWYC